MAINYTAAYKYDANSVKLSEYIQRAAALMDENKYNYVYFPTALKAYKSIACEPSRLYGHAGLYLPEDGYVMWTEITTPFIHGFNVDSFLGYDNMKFYPILLKTAEPNYAPNFGFVDIPYTFSQLKSEGFDTIINGYAVYDNSNDGTYSETNPRIQYNQNFFAGLYMTSASERVYRNGVPNDITFSFEYLFNAGVFAKMYSAYPAQPSVNHLAWNITQMFPDLVRFIGATNSDCTPITDGNGFITGWNNYTAGFSACIVNRKKFIKFLKLFGIPYTLDPAVKYKNIEDFPDYIPDGQPTNPTDDGGGDGDNDSDDMELPNVQLSPTNTFSRLSCCTITELNKLSNFLFTSTFYDNIKLLTNDPLESLCNVMYYPFDVLNHSTCGGAHGLILTNVSTPATVYDLNVSYNMYLDMGHIDVNPYYGSYLDYSPNTEIELYLPYRGYVNLPTNDIIGRQLSVKYMIDFYSGNATILVFADTKLVHISNAQVGINIPISQSNANSRAISLTTAAVGAVGTIAGGAIGGAAGGLAGAAIGAGQAAGANAIPTANRIFNAAQNHVDKGGSFGGVGWLYAPQVCSLIFNRPILAEPTAYKTMNGYSTSFSGLVSSYSGFLQADSISGTTGATDEENNMIFNLLRNGIYV